MEEPLLFEDAKLQLSHGFTLVDNKDGISVESKLRDYEFEAAEAEKLKKMIPILDGNTTLAQLAQRCDMGVDDAKEFASELYKLGIVYDDSEALVPGILFYENVRARIRAASAHSKNIEAVWNGTITAKWLLGMLIEEWQFVRINPDHTSRVTGNARHHETQQAWAAFVADEYTHGEWLREGVAHVLTAEELMYAQPLPSTEAFSNSMRWAATRGELHYALCLSLLETDEDHSNDATTPVPMYEKMRSLDLLPPKTFDMYIKHGYTDMEADHIGFCTKPFELHAPFSRDFRNELARMAWNHFQTNEMLDNGIYEYYSREDTPRVHTLPEHAHFVKSMQ